MKARGASAREVVAPAEAVVGIVGLVEEGVAAGFPIEASGVDDDSADAGAVAAEPLGEGVDDDVGAVLEWLGEDGGGEGVVDDEGDAELFGFGTDGFEVGYLEGWVGNRLGEEGAGLIIGGGAEGGRVLRIDEADFDAELGEDIVKLGETAAVEIACGDDVVALLGDVDDGIEDGGGAGGVGEAGHFVGAFEERDAFFEDVGRRVHQAGVDVSELFEGKQVGGVFGGIENERCGPVDGDGAGIGGGIGLLAAVEAEGFLFHGVKSGKGARLRKGNGQRGRRKKGGEKGALESVAFRPGRCVAHLRGRREGDCSISDLGGAWGDHIFGGIRPAMGFVLRAAEGGGEDPSRD